MHEEIEGLQKSFKDVQLRVLELESKNLNTNEIINKSQRQLKRKQQEKEDVRDYVRELEIKTNNIERDKHKIYQE